MRGVRSSLAALAVAVYAIVPLLAPSYTYQLTIVLAVGLAGLAVSVLLRAGLITFGQALFYGVGAYGAAFITRSLDTGIISTLILSAICALVLAIPVGLFIVRYRGIFFAMLNLALSMVLYTVLLKFYDITGGSDGIGLNVTHLLGWQLSSQGYGYALFYIALALVGTTGWAVNHYWQTPCGWALMAIQDSEIRVEYLGRSARGILLFAYIVAALLAGLGGGVAALAVGHVAPDIAYWTASAGFLMVAVLGGSRSIFGPFLGALVFEFLSISASQYISSWWELLLGIIIFLVIRFAPGGLWSLYEDWWEKHPRFERRSSADVDGA